VTDAYPPFELGYPRTELRRQLVDAVLTGVKTATAGLWSEYEAEGEGFESIEDWRVAHENFFNQPIAPETEIVAVRFRVAERI
jgi:uncharacterized protein YhfF